MIKQYIATPWDEEEIYVYCDGDTPDEAFNALIASEDLHRQISRDYYQPPNEIDIHIYTWVTPENSDYPEEELDPDWLFVLDKKIETRTYKLPQPQAAGE
ncbi:MAG: hypothetical protein HUJ30_03530 [Gammaproteobacteria bacterium]|nr:hypothetical protein [Gammaproteobacteria bacterium]